MTIFDRKCFTAMWCLWLIAFPLRLKSADIELKISGPSGREIAFSDVISTLRDSRAVFIGENHDRYDNHLAELEIIRRLNEIQPGRWAIGVEFIQRSFQAALDAYLNGVIDEYDFLKRTEYFDRWGFDYRLYRPIFLYAKENHIPMIALNAEKELTEEVARRGLEGLSPADRSRVPQQIDKSNSAYRDRLHAIFEQHPAATKGNFERFFEAQLTWDETMAESCARYLAVNPARAMIVLAGAEHIAFGSGIPDRVKRRGPDLKSAIILIDRKPEEGKTAADYVVNSPQSELPAAGKMGIAMDNQPAGLIAKQLTEGGAAAQAGMKRRDRIAAIDGQPVHSIADARLALLDKKPGDVVSLQVQRTRWFGKKDLTLRLKLTN